MPNDSPSLWNRYEVTIKTRGRLIGGLPRSKELIDGWLKARAEKLPRPAEEIAAETAEKVGLTDEQTTEGLWVGFASDDQGLYLEGRCIKAMFKEAANVMREVLRTSGLTNRRHPKAEKRFTNYRAKLAERLFVEGDRIHVGQSEPSGTEERPIHVMTAQGPRTALKRFDYIDPVTVSFVVKLLSDDLVDEPVLRILLEYAGENGLGADRSQGFGTFDVLRIDAIG